MQWSCPLYGVLHQERWDLGSLEPIGIRKHIVTCAYIRTILSSEERCQAIINNGKQCSRRKKYFDFCGKHKLKQPFGIVTKTLQDNITKDKQTINLFDNNLIEVKQFQYKDKEYLIDNNKIIFNKIGTEIIGKLNNNNEIYII